MLKSIEELTIIIDGHQKTWRDDTMVDSTGRYRNHPAYKAIIGLAFQTDAKGIPFRDDRVATILFDRLHLIPWYFEALREILHGENEPYIPKEIRGRIQCLIEIYLRWGRALGLTKNKPVLTDISEVQAYDAWIKQHPKITEVIQDTRKTCLDPIAIAQFALFSVKEQNEN